MNRLAVAPETRIKLCQSTGFSKVIPGDGSRFAGLLLFLLVCAPEGDAAFEIRGRDLWLDAVGCDAGRPSPARIGDWGTGWTRGRASLWAGWERRFGRPEFGLYALAAALPVGRWELGAALSQFGWEAWKEAQLSAALACDAGPWTLPDASFETVRFRWRLGLGYGRAGPVGETQRRVVEPSAGLELDHAGWSAGFGLRTQVDQPGGPLAPRSNSRSWRSFLGCRLPRGWKICLAEEAGSLNRRERRLCLAFSRGSLGAGLSLAGERGWRLALRWEGSRTALVILCWWHPRLPLSPASAFEFF